MKRLMIFLIPALAVSLAPPLHAQIYGAAYIDAPTFQCRPYGSCDVWGTGVFSAGSMHASAYCAIDGENFTDVAAEVQIFVGVANGPCQVVITSEL